MKSQLKFAGSSAPLSSSGSSQVPGPGAAQPCAASLWSGGEDAPDCRAGRTPASPGRRTSATQRPKLGAAAPGLHSLHPVQKPGSAGEVPHATHATDSLVFHTLTDTSVCNIRASDCPVTGCHVHS